MDEMAANFSAPTARLAALALAGSTKSRPTSGNRPEDEYSRAVETLAVSTAHGVVIEALIYVKDPRVGQGPGASTLAVGIGAASPSLGCNGGRPRFQKAFQFAFDRAIAKLMVGRDGVLYHREAKDIGGIRVALRTGWPSLQRAESDGGQ